MSEKVVRPKIIQIIKIDEFNMYNILCGYSLIGLDDQGNTWLRRYDRWDTWELDNPTKIKKESDI